MSRRVTPAWIMQVAHDCNNYDGVLWYEQGLVKNFQDADGSVIGVVEEPSGTELKVWVGITDGQLSYDCEDCFPPEASHFDDDAELAPEPRLCIHAAAVAMAAAESGVDWYETSGRRGLRSL